MTLDISRFISSKYGKRIALIDWGGENYSYLDVERIANYIVGRLKEDGIVKGDRVSVISQNKAALVILYLACQKIGAILVPNNLRLTEQELLSTNLRVEPKIIVLSESLQEKYGRLCAVLAVKVEILERIGRPVHVTSNETVEVDLETPSLILFTGGTTGEPKGAVLSNRSIIFNAINTVLSWKLSENDRTVLVYPLFHTGGWNVLTIPLLIAGGSIILVDKFDASLVLRIMDGMKITVFSGVPAMMAQISESENFNGSQLSSLRFVKSGGGTTPEHVTERFRNKGINFYQGYGLTEAGPNLFYSNEDDLNRPFSIGRKSLFVDLKLLDQNGQESDLGELMVGGPVIFSGYFRDAKKTEDIMNCGMVRTGDILRRDEDGFYYFVGRIKFMYKSGGENVYPSEVEKVLESYSGIYESAVIGVPDDKWGEVGAAFIDVRRDIDLKELKEWLSTKMANYAVPKYFRVVKSIPKTGAGKKDYTLMRKWYNEWKT
ncbi:MAG: AMP-binding protein [Candidatus Thermoplasmatota archaeon]|jgi:fatty-acyl-CoA synthase|nr:AMP-binding protein [Candidatus Thermoplasmatota archaeon]